MMNNNNNHQDSINYIYLYDIYEEMFSLFNRPRKQKRKKK